MFKRVLVPLDGTPEAASALPTAETLARTGQGELLLVRVGADYHAGSPARAEAEGYLERVAADLRSRGLRAEATVRYGDVAEEILAEATARRADLIAMATHGRSGLRRALLGSVTERVVHHSPVPVVVTRPDERPTERLATLL